MKTVDFFKNIRGKPRLKLSNRIGYSLVNSNKFKKSRRRKWSRFQVTKFRKPNQTFQARLQAGVSLKKLYGQRLMAKQALRAYYGKITEKELKNIIHKSEFGKGSSQESLRGLFERRLDVLVYRLGYAKTMYKARQMVSHKFFKVNGKPVNTPGLILEVGDYLTVADRVWDQVYHELAQQVLLYKKHYSVDRLRILLDDTPKRISKLRKVLARPATTTLKHEGQKYTFHYKSLRYRPIKTPKYLEFDYSTLTALLVSLPNQNNVPYRNNINFKYIREFY